MTAAVCLECGRMKTGAWARCPGCSYMPQTLEDKARHLITTDHYLKPDRLEAAARQIQAGQKLQFVPEQVRAVMEELARLEKDPEEKKRLRSKRLGRLVVRLALAGLVLAGLWLWWSRR